MLLDVQRPTRSLAALLFGVFFSVSAQAETHHEWEQGQPPVKMESVDTHVCVLTGVAGKFRDSEDQVRVHIQDGVWQLDGPDRPSGLHEENLFAEAMCFELSSFTSGNEGEVKWISDEFSVSASSNGSCDRQEGIAWKGDAPTIINGISGVFGRREEGVSVIQSISDAETRLVAKSCNQGGLGLTAFSFFVGVPHSGHVAKYYHWSQDAIFREPDDYSIGFKQNQGNPVTTARTDQAMCYLSGIYGNFDGGADSVDIKQGQGDDGSSRWILSVRTGKRNQQGVRAMAYCYAFAQ